MAAKQPKTQTQPTIRVKAIRMGYIYDRRQRPGDVFDVVESQFSDRWMQKVDAHTPTSQSDSLGALQRQLAQQKAADAAGIPVAAGRDDDEVI